MAKLLAKSGDPDQTPHFAAFDLGLHCLPVTLLWISRLQWVNASRRYSGIPELKNRNHNKNCEVACNGSTMNCLFNHTEVLKTDIGITDRRVTDSELGHKLYNSYSYLVQD